MAKDKKPVDWPGIERDFTKTDLSIREMARWYGITDTAIRLRAKQEGWGRPGAKKPDSDRSKPEPVVYVREPTVLTAENTDPSAILGRGRNLTLRLLDELDATSAHLGEIEDAIVAETGADTDGRRREAMLKAVSLKSRADTLKALTLAAKTLAESSAPEGKKAQRQAAADATTSAGKFAQRSGPRLVASNP